MARQLHHDFPQSRALPHVELATLPTPVEPLEALRESLGLRSLWVKRDDLTGTLYGGNKVRKLEFLLADVMERGHERVWTVGAIGSHHVLATCIWARELGLDCGALHFPQPMTSHVAKNIRALSTTRPAIHLLGDEEPMRPEIFKKRLREWFHAHPDEAYIPAGGSSAIGALGYVNAALELVAQVRRGECPRPRRIYVAAGTCGTLAGLLLGFAMVGFDVDVVGVRVVDRAIANERVVARLANQAADLLRGVGVSVEREISPADVVVRDDLYGAGYGKPSPDGMAAIGRVAAAGAAFQLEPTYTARAFAAVIADAPSVIGEDDDVLYWHTLSGADLDERVTSADLSALPRAYAEWIRAFEEE